MKQTLNDAIKAHIDSKRLDAAQLDALASLQQAQNKRLAGQNPQHSGWIAMMVVVLISAALLLSQIEQTSEHADLIETIAHEVVGNHLNRKPLEVTTNSIAGIQGYFDQLDFSPVSSYFLADRDLSLLGGRYCSLQGVTAAQLRLESADSNYVHTLYQVGYEPKVFKKLPNLDQGDAPVTTWSGGVPVTLWVEKGVLFALTEEPNTEGDPR